MQNNRRKLMLTGGLLAGGVALGGLRAVAAGDGLSSGLRDVTRFVTRYGTIQKTAGGDRPATEILVKMRSVGDFAKVLGSERGLPFDRVHAAGNTLKFQHRGTQFTIVNVA